MGYRIWKDRYKGINEMSEHKCIYCLDILNEKDSDNHTLIEIFLFMRDMGEKWSFLMISLNRDVYEKLGINQNQLFKNVTREIIGDKYQRVFDVKIDHNIDFKWEYEARIKKADKIWNLLLEMLENSEEDFYID